LLSVVVHPANIQDRDGLHQVLHQARPCFPFIERIFADAGYQGPKAAKATADTGCWTLEIVKRSEAHHFVVLPKRWIVERSFAWITFGLPPQFAIAGNCRLGGAADLGLV
jgi:transposase